MCELTARFSSFDISHVKRNLNDVTDNLAVYAAHLDRHNLVERPDCSVISLYRPYLPNNEESWQVFEHDESLHAFLMNEDVHDFEMISLEHNKYPKGLSPLESNFSSADASKNSFTPENPKRKIDDTILVNIGSEEDPKNVYISITCTKNERNNLLICSKNLKIFLHGLMQT